MKLELKKVVPPPPPEKYEYVITITEQDRTDLLALLGPTEESGNDIAFRLYRMLEMKHYRDGL